MAIQRNQSYVGLVSMQSSCNSVTIQKTVEG